MEREKRDDQEKIKTLTDDLQPKSGTIKELEEKCNYQEDYSRRNNLQIVGMEEHQEETWTQTAGKVKKLLEDKLQLPSLELERAHRVGQRNELRHRPVIA